MPAPASEVVTTFGKKFNKMGISWPKFLFEISYFETLLNAIGILSLTLTEDTITSSRFWTSSESKMDSCALSDKLKANRTNTNFFMNI